MFYIIVNFNLTQDNCTSFLRGIAACKGQIKSSYSIASPKDLEDIKTVSFCSCDYLVQFPSKDLLSKFKENYPKFHYEDKENPVTN